MRRSSVLFLALLCLVMSFSIASCKQEGMNYEEYWNKFTSDTSSTHPVDTPSTHPSDTTGTQIDTSEVQVDPIVDPIIEPVEDSLLRATTWEYPSDGTGTGTVLIVGGGATGVAAALECSRLGVQTILVEEYPWLGGMLTSAGVTATDGCYNLRGGIFGEFADALAKHYGGLSKLKTGWVSNMLFEPKVGEEILEKMCAAEPCLTVEIGWYMTGLSKKSRGWTVTFAGVDGGSKTIDCEVLIDGTELGDVAKAAGVKYHIGMDSQSYTGESQAIGPNEIIQDITMVMTIKNYGKDMTIAKPEGYDESKYVNCCKNSYNTPFDTGQTLWSPAEMMSYGLLPGGEVMLNWPIFGNDYYVNIIEMSRSEREAAIAKAKQHSLGYLYFMQTKLGYNKYGLADDQYPTDDRFPFIPYHRESRRIEGEYLFTVTECSSPFTYKTPGYRTGIAVGDYPVDHHHYQYAGWKSVQINFPKIVPFALPLGCLIPLGVEDLIVGEKSISVSNIVNGTTRLQPVTLQIGQASGVIAALSILGGRSPREVDIRRVQSILLEAGAYIEPYLDTGPGMDGYEAVQRIGATGILRGKGETVGWSNQCNFNVSNALKWSDLYLSDYYGIPYNNSSAQVTGDEFIALFEQISGKPVDGLDKLVGAKSLTRKQAAIYLDSYLHPFESIPLHFDGTLAK